MSVAHKNKHRFDFKILYILNYILKEIIILPFTEIA